MISTHYVHMDNPGGHPLSQLVKSDDHFEDICKFLDGGGDPNYRVIESNSLLHVAAQSYQLNKRAVQKLINAGADIESRTSFGSTALQFAVMSCNREVVEALIQAGAQINVKNSLGRTALHYAIYSCRPRHMTPRLTSRHFFRKIPDMWIVERLLEHRDTDINPVDSEGDTPLMWAVKRRNLDAVKILLKRGANPSIPNKQAQNSLHVALSVRDPNEGIVHELLSHGVSIYNKNSSGQTPIDILLQTVTDISTFYFASECLALIALKYQIRKKLESKVRRIPELLEFLKKACEEVEWMNKKIAYDNVTLHDFANDCFQEQIGGVPTLDIYKRVIGILLSERFNVFTLDILNRMSILDLYRVLKRIVPQEYFLEFVINNPHATQLEIFQSIQEYYGEMRQANVGNRVM